MKVRFAVPAAFGFARLKLTLHAVGLLNTREGVIALEVVAGAAFATVVLTTFFARSDTISKAPPESMEPTLCKSCGTSSRVCVERPLRGRSSSSRT